jgi:hypothetical protein
MLKKFARWLKIELLQHQYHVACREYRRKPSLRTLADRFIAENAFYEAKFGFGTFAL